MENLSNELSKLKIDKSQRMEPRRGGKAWIVVIVLLLLAGAGYAVFNFRGAAAAPAVETVRPRPEVSSQSAVLVATGYVIAHHKIQVGSKIAGRVSWIGVEKGAAFGVLIALIACHFGLRVEPNTQSLGEGTTRSVVASITAVILADAVFAIMTSKGWFG